jgi:predicted RNA-binding Zn-ribbon protein involved in translation (DUF1610 family)
MPEQQEDKQPRCQSCGHIILVLGTVGRRETCPNCGVDLHACVQCEFYDPFASDQCREPQSERVANKETANFCDFFRSSRTPVEARKSSAADEAKARLDALFKK